MTTPTANKFAELLALAKARREGKSIIPPPATIAPSEVKKNNEATVHTGIDRYGNTIEWNAEQWQFIQTVASGSNGILIGAAGTGKTTTMRGAIEELLRTRHFPAMDDEHKYLPAKTPGIVAVSYTRRAVMNLKRAMPPDLQANCITIHKLLEYAPVFYEVQDENGNTVNKMNFEPTRNQFRPLSHNIKTVIIDEASMVSVSLFYQVWCALPNPHNVQFIFLGDIQQLPPVFGSAILGYKMLTTPTVELVRVYRQALESPIIRLAHRILSGNGIPKSEFSEWKVENQLTLHPWKKKISADNALLTLAGFFKNGYDSNLYNPMEDMILIPFNKACGTDELNKHIANHIARKNQRVTFEVVAGFNRHYFSIGDKVLYEKEDAEIINIEVNPTYSGKWPQAPSVHLDYWGTVQAQGIEAEHHIQEEHENIDFMLSHMSAADDETRVREASHIITLAMRDSDQEIKVKTAAGINGLILSYALTIHKSQGSEWRKVFLCLHHTHNTMLQRELLYTACTRAREELYVICEPDSFQKGIVSQRIKGQTLKDKAEHFMGKLERGEESLIEFLKNHEQKPAN